MRCCRCVSKFLFQTTMHKNPPVSDAPHTINLLCLICHSCEQITDGEMIRRFCCEHLAPNKSPSRRLALLASVSKKSYFSKSTGSQRRAAANLLTVLRLVS